MNENASGFSFLAEATYRLRAQKVSLLRSPWSLPICKCVSVGSSRAALPFESPDEETTRLKEER